jgi:alanine racemase
VSYITLNKQAFFQNANYYTNILKNKNKLCIALKDNAYGHGIEEIAQFSFEYGIKHCIVKNIYEADKLDNYAFDSIIILYDIPHKKYPNNYIFAINAIENIHLYPENTIVELKIDTGMSRNGIQLQDLTKALELIVKHKLIINGVFTHFHSASADDATINHQELLFQNAIQIIKKNGFNNFRIHCSNTAGVNKINNSLYDLARIGIGLYGYCTSSQKYLKPVMSLYANKISSRVLNIGDSIGYGANYIVSQNNTLVSNYDIGYGDGLFRINKNDNVVFENNKKLLGTISMDSFSTFGNDSEVCIFSNASSLAKIHNTIEYEILTQLMPTIQKKII